MLYRVDFQLAHLFREHVRKIVQWKTFGNFGMVIYNLNCNLRIFNNYFRRFSPAYRLRGFQGFLMQSTYSPARNRAGACSLWTIVVYFQISQKSHGFHWNCEIVVRLHHDRTNPGSCRLPIGWIFVEIILWWRIFGISIFSTAMHRQHFYHKMIF